MSQEEVKDQEEKEEQGEEEAQEQQLWLPPVNFENFVLGLYNTSLIHLGVRDPETGQLIQNLYLARHTIDTLGMIQEKTKGNLTAPESNLLENLLYELRMGYLRAAKQAEEEQTKESEPEKEEAESREKPETQEEPVAEAPDVEAESKKGTEAEEETVKPDEDSEARKASDKDSP